MLVCGNTAAMAGDSWLVSLGGVGGGGQHLRRGQQRGATVYRGTREGWGGGRGWGGRSSSMTATTVYALPTPLAPPRTPPETSVPNSPSSPLSRHPHFEVTGLNPKRLNPKPHTAYTLDPWSLIHPTP